ncbi:hypothetical protein [Paraburkholderia silvatlantica]|uniref:Uncharacterized protein n=1 Tax=Paraburkholderia silvatlantica TaxID=321895 RepID=A0ABR6FLP2_9BURK|nr:hypothetical protein [Paraburkholderia silvatlantica]MBB2928355.1 hypothetical protein [Paraburkholderia silvatlantica]PVY34598.1 hypothetical protein C7411_107134 [Paraburkholderia silvatlantica]PXW38813.1 hypothetical protein C7413_107134 [Paraburkholderia silvatlantica]
MTVAELMRELERYPAHYVVAVAVDGDWDDDAPRTDEHYIEDVTEGERGEVRIDCTSRRY